jgi:hypothetical protein
MLLVLLLTSVACNRTRLLGNVGVLDDDACYDSDFLSAGWLDCVSLSSMSCKSECPVREWDCIVHSCSQSYNLVDPQLSWVGFDMRCTYQFTECSVGATVSAAGVSRCHRTCGAYLPFGMIAGIVVVAVVMVIGGLIACCYFCGWCCCAGSQSRANMMATPLSSGAMQTGQAPLAYGQVPQGDQYPPQYYSPAQQL